jgi:hypothetical protein
MAAIFYDAVATNRSYSTYGMKPSALSPTKTDIYVQSPNPGFKVGDYVKWVSPDGGKSWTSKVVYRTFEKKTSEYPLGYYILTVNNAAYRTNTGFGGQLSIAPQSNAVEDDGKIPDPPFLFGMSKKKVIIGLVVLAAGYFIIKKKLWKKVM